MSNINLELRLFLRSKLAVIAIIALFVLASLAVWSGMTAAAAQKDALMRISAAHQQDVAAVMAKYKQGGDAGYAAYYTFHLTWDEPSPLAFVAFGQRDLQPYALRIRMLGLHSQLYESETFNPELALAGRFDFAFVLVYLVPLFVIALMHDWATAERETGRLRLLMSMPMQTGGLWWRRAVLRYALILAALVLPLVVGFMLTGTSAVHGAGVLMVTVLYTAFWVALALMAGAIARSSASAAAMLLGLFVFLTLLLPTLANAAITRLIPVGKGVELAMAQREEVHQGWDLPKPATMEKFFRNHPEWSNTSPVTGRFHWKWYYAMHQVGDEAVEQQVAQYRRSMLQRDEWTHRAAWLLPAAAAQVALHRLADTDLHAQLAYWDQIAQFHTRLRRFYYPYVFLERPFGPRDFRLLPAYQSREPTGALPFGLVGALALAVLGIGACGLIAVRRVPLAAGEEDVA